MTPDEKQSMLLVQLVALFQTAALQQMGKLKNPVTDTLERDLAQAQISIDMVEMLHTKMKGNLTADEERMMSTILRDLRLNYVDEVQKDSSTTQEPPPAEGTKEPSP